jgi:hypothetical protein
VRERGREKWSEPPCQFVRGVEEREGGGLVLSCFNPGVHCSSAFAHRFLDYPPPLSDFFYLLH